MTTTTSDTLTVGGVVLNTLGYNIEIAAYGMQSREVRHQTIPRRAGALRRAPRERPAEMDISLWVSDRDADGVPGGQSQLWTNVDLIMAAVSTTDLVAVSRVRNGTTLTTEAELSGQVMWERHGPKALRVSIPFTMPYPYWLGTQVAPSLTGAGGTLDNDGHVDASRIGIVMTAGVSGWTAPSIENETTGITMSYTGTISASGTITVDLWEGTVYDQAQVSRSGLLSVNAPFWTLATGENTIALDDSGGGGSVVFTYSPPYMI